jgi:hypothetical protein
MASTAHNPSKMRASFSDRPPYGGLSHVPLPKLRAGRTITPPTHPPCCAEACAKMTTFPIRHSFENKLAPSQHKDPGYCQIKLREVHAPKSCPTGATLPVSSKWYFRPTILQVGISILRQTSYRLASHIAVTQTSRGLFLIYSPTTTLLLEALR